MGGVQALACSPQPSLPEEVAEKSGRLPIDGHLYIMKRRVSLPIGIFSPRILQFVIGRIPAVLGQVDAAAKGQGIVHHHKLLMMGRACGMLFVEMEMEAFMGLPSEFYGGQQFTFQGVDERKIPAEDIDLQPGRGLGLFIEIGAQLNAGPISLRSNQSDPAVNVPPADIYGLLRLIHDGNKALKVGVHINQDGYTVRVSDPPAVASFSEYV
ncbi:MAG: hypothetical protein U5R49_00180 [Deltaproteobacteria bacterium]|nr:hypothetical protein [Deltaproteobacteria bacterium]